jgi:hypothetical protein
MYVSHGGFNVFPVIAAEAGMVTTSARAKVVAAKFIAMNPASKQL